MFYTWKVLDGVEFGQLFSCGVHDNQTDQRKDGSGEVRWESGVYESVLSPAAF